MKFFDLHLLAATVVALTVGCASSTAPHRAAVRPAEPGPATPTGLRCGDRVCGPGQICFDAHRGGPPHEPFPPYCVDLASQCGHTPVCECLCPDASRVPAGASCHVEAHTADCYSWIEP